MQCKQQFSIALKMSNFLPTKQHLREVLLHYFILKKSAAESYRLLVETYNDNAPSERSCREWFQRFKDGDYDVKDKERFGAPKKFMKSWKHYSLKIHIKRLKNCRNH